MLNLSNVRLKAHVEKETALEEGATRILLSIPYREPFLYLGSHGYLKVQVYRTLPMDPLNVLGTCIRYCSALGVHRKTPRGVIGVHVPL